jgi:hypothetical protein
VCQFSLAPLLADIPILQQRRNASYTCQHWPLINCLRFVCLIAQLGNMTTLRSGATSSLRCLSKPTATSRHTV